jgi:hypothetical protein
MSLSAIGAAISATNILNPAQQQRKDIQSIQQALSKGDVTGAQAALADLEKTFKSSASAAATTTTTGSTASGVAAAPTSLSADLNALTQALSSSNLSAAQTAFNQLKTDLPSGHHHHARGAGKAASATASSAVNAASVLSATGASTPSGTLLNVKA